MSCESCSGFSSWACGVGGGVGGSVDELSGSEPALQTLSDRAGGSVTSMLTGTGAKRGRRANSSDDLLDDTCNGSTCDDRCALVALDDLFILTSGGRPKGR